MRSAEAEAEALPERHSSVPYSLFNEPSGFRPFVDARLSRSGWDVKRFLKDFSACLAERVPFSLLAKSDYQRPSEVSSGFLKKIWSGRPDSNRRFPAPKAGAITKLRYAPKALNRGRA